MQLPAPLLVAVGALAGATLRWGVEEAVDDQFWALAVVNTTGTLLLAALVVGADGPWRDDVRLVVGVGFCGALTTFSTLAVEVAARLDEGDPAAALGVLAWSLVLGVVALAVVRRRRVT